MAEVRNISSWIAENEKFFAPPVCNKLMFNEGQLKIMFVGGPNIRKDYHLEAGEELFYMVKGDMLLKIMEHGQPKDVHIREGEVFVLPSHIPHSPQRFADTIGLVIERERDASELDGLRYYCPSDATATLWEKYFHCTDLGVQLPPVMKEYFESAEFKSGVPSATSVVAHPPIVPSLTKTTHTPFPLKKWVDEHAAAIRAGSATMFSEGEFQVQAIGKSHAATAAGGEYFLWQFSGSSSAVVAGATHALKEGDVVIVRDGNSFDWTQTEGSVGLVISMRRL